MSFNIGNLFRRSGASLTSWLCRHKTQLEATAYLVQIIGLPFLSFGILLTLLQLRLTGAQVQYAAQQTQGQTMLTIGKDSRELFFRVWEDSKLRPILDPAAPNEDAAKARAFIGTMIAHYAMIFRQWRLGNIPDEYWREASIDAQTFFRSTEVSARWAEVRRFYNKDFREFIDSLPKEERR